MSLVPAQRKLLTLGHPRPRLDGMSKAQPRCAACGGTGKAKMAGDVGSGEYARQIRRAAGLTQEDVAGRMGVVGSAVSYWESGHRAFTAEQWELYQAAIAKGGGR